MKEQLNERRLARALEILNINKAMPRILQILAESGDEILQEGQNSREMEVAFWATFVDTMLHPFAEANARKRAIARYAVYISALFEEEVKTINERMKK